jgi:hypothetical protein
VTDAGLPHLLGLTSLSSLDLARTAVTDAGLTHLKVLAGLRWLDLSHTLVTEQGARELERTLPAARISR